jgi:hypothetical protein
MHSTTALSCFTPPPKEFDSSHLLSARCLVSSAFLSFVLTPLGADYTRTHHKPRRDIRGLLFLLLRTPKTEYLVPVMGGGWNGRSILGLPAPTEGSRSSIHTGVWGRFTGTFCISGRRPPLWKRIRSFPFVVFLGVQRRGYTKLRMEPEPVSRVSSEYTRPFVAVKHYYLLSSCLL